MSDVIPFISKEEKTEYSKISTKPSASLARGLRERSKQDSNETPGKDKSFFLRNEVPRQLEICDNNYKNQLEQRRMATRGKHRPVTLHTVNPLSCYAYIWGWRGIPGVHWAAKEVGHSDIGERFEAGIRALVLSADEVHREIMNKPLNLRHTADDRDAVGPELKKQRALFDAVMDELRTFPSMGESLPPTFVH